MRKAVFSLVGVLLFFMVMSVGYADPVLVDVTTFNAAGTNPGGDLDGFGRGDVNLLDGFGDFVAWTHHFDVPAGTITSASLVINFLDNDRDWSFFGIPIDNEFAAGWSEDWSFDFGEVDSGPAGPYNVNVTYLADGEFSVIVTSLGGDFYIVDSTLTINSVPEPATVLLFGLGLVGIGAWKRKG